MYLEHHTVTELYQMLERPKYS